MPERRFCSQCGSGVDPTDAFCARCGEQLEPAGLWAGSSGVKTVEAPAAPPRTRPEPVTAPSSPRRWRPWHAAVVIAALGVVAAAVVTITLVQRSRDERAVVAAAETWLAELRGQGDVTSLAGESLELPLEEGETVALSRVGEVTLTRVSDHASEATVPTSMTLKAELPDRYGDATTEIQSGWTVTLNGDKSKRLWLVTGVKRTGGFKTLPKARPEPSAAEIAAARSAAEKAVIAAFTFDAKQELSEYAQRQPDAYLAAPVALAEAERLSADGSFGAETSVPPLIIERTAAFSDDQELHGTAYDNGQELVTQAMPYCSGDRSLRRLSATVDGWRTETVESGPLAVLQRVALSGTLHLSGQATCRTTDFWTGDASTQRDRVSVDVPVQASLVRPHAQDGESAWRLQALTTGENGMSTIYSAG